MSARICPYIGLAEDPETSLAFPSELNCCHWATPIEPISLDHQRSFCLSTRFSRCGMLETREHRALLPTIKLGGPRQGIPIRWVFGLLVLIGLFAIGYLFFQMWGFAAPGVAPDNGTLGSGNPPENLLPTAASSPTTLNGNLPSPGPASGGDATAAVIREVTLTPLQSTPTPIIVTEAVFLGSPTFTPQVCGPFEGWVLYTVQPNDTLFGLSLIFEVSIADLQFANCLGDSTSIQVGQRLYVPFPFVVVPTAIPTQTQLPIITTATSTEPPPTVQPPSATPFSATDTAVPASSTPIIYATPTPVPPLPSPVPSTTPG